MLRSSCFPTPTWTQPLMGPFRPSSAMPVRRAFVPIAFLFSRKSTTNLSPVSPPRPRVRGNTGGKDYLTKGVAALKVGNGFESGVAVGPLIDGAAVDKVSCCQLRVLPPKDALRHCRTWPMPLPKEPRLSRAVFLPRFSVPCPSCRSECVQGLFMTPTVLRGVTSDMQCAKEETFGPVAPIFRFSSEQEAVALANSTESGLAS